MGASGTNFEIVDPAACWPLLRRLQTEAEDIIDTCRRGEALMFSGPAGTFALGLVPGENADQLEAFVYLAVAARHGAFDEAEPAVLAVARDLGATTVAFRSMRRGWARRLGAAWKPRSHGEFWRYVDGAESRSPRIAA